MHTVPSMFARTTENPRKTALVLLVGSVFTASTVWLGDLAFDRGWTGARWLAWPGGATVFFVPAFISWLLLLVPSGRVDGRWTRRVAVMIIWGTATGGIVQLLDDHVFNHPGTENPLGISIPFPFQDLLTLVALVLLGVGFLGTLITFPQRLAARNRRSTA